MSTGINYYVYIVECADKTLYTGVAQDLAGRIGKHNLGTGAKYTRGRRPVILVYYEDGLDLSSALRRERSIKRLNRQKKLALIENRRL